MPGVPRPGTCWFNYPRRANCLAMWTGKQIAGSNCPLCRPSTDASASVFHTLKAGVLGALHFRFWFFHVLACWHFTISYVSTLLIQYLLSPLFSLSEKSHCYLLFTVASFHFSFFGGRATFFFFIMFCSYFPGVFMTSETNTSCVWHVYLERPLFTLLSLGISLTVVLSEIRNLISVF